MKRRCLLLALAAGCSGSKESTSAGPAPVAASAAPAEPAPDAPADPAPDAPSREALEEAEIQELRRRAIENARGNMLGSEALTPRDPSAPRDPSPPAAPAPPPVPPVSEPTCTGELDLAIIRRAIEDNMPEIRLCYEAELLALPEIEGQVTAQFTIGLSGQVLDVAASGVHAEVSSCVAAVIDDIEFTKPKGMTPVRCLYPFTFVPRRRR